MKTTTKILFASAFVIALAAPAIAQSSAYGDQAATHRHQAHSVAVKRGGNAFAMQSRFGGASDSDSPAQTGGASLGYNQKLLKD